ncbi:MAG: hypothetical protein KGZ88_11800 [Methylomicrobium sp.]|nr:hypothetical protein [Methylomicrobium sp.]
MPLPVQALLVSFVLFALTMKTVWLIASLVCLVVVFIYGFRGLWPRS